ncbi:MAG: YdcF family protein [Oscillospiraceae bacterium]|nr:YdcF family protein [Oscillospiraceae bacterium]
MTEILDSIRQIGPFFAAAWIVTIICVVLRPQRYINSFLLLWALFITLFFMTGFFPHGARVTFLFVSFLIVMFALFLAPLLLIINGIQMIRRESLCLAHVLSLGLGIVVGVGEIAAVIYVLDLAEYLDIGNTNNLFMFVIFTVFYFSFLVLSFVIYTVFMQIMPHRMNFNYVVIHGCGLRDGEHLTKLLSDRVDKAIEIYGKCKIKPYIIPSGGKGSDEKLSEAEAMKNYLVDHGIPEDHIILEDSSATTRENLINSKAIIDSREGKKKTALVSSNYHVYRCLRLARDLKFSCIGIGAHVAMYYWPSALIREFIAIFLTKRFFIWSILGYLAFISPLLLVFFSK